MTELYMKRNLSGLEPADGVDMPPIKLGDTVKVKITSVRTRSQKHHRKFFALMGLIFKNQETYETLDDLVYAIKIATGHRKTYTKGDGTPFHAPRSIAFNSMDQIGFNAFYDKVITLICQKIIPGLDENDLRREIEEMTT